MGEEKSTGDGGGTNKHSHNKRKRKIVSKQKTIMHTEHTPKLRNAEIWKFFVYNIMGFGGSVH